MADSYKIYYRWYDFEILREFPKIFKLIEDCITNHDYNTFQGFQFILNNITANNGRKIEFLPNTVYIYNEEKGKGNGGFWDILNEERFKQINEPCCCKLKEFPGGKALTFDDITNDRKLAKQYGK